MYLRILLSSIFIFVTLTDITNNNRIILVKLISYYASAGRFSHSVLGVKIKRTFYLYHRVTSGKKDIVT